MKRTIEKVTVAGLTAQNIRSSMDWAALERLAESLGKGQKDPNPTERRSP